MPKPYVLLLIAALFAVTIVSVVGTENPAFTLAAISAGFLLVQLASSKPKVTRKHALTILGGALLVLANSLIVPAVLAEAPSLPASFNIAPSFLAMAGQAVGSFGLFLFLLAGGVRAIIENTQAANPSQAKANTNTRTHPTGPWG